MGAGVTLQQCRFCRWSESRGHLVCLADGEQYAWQVNPCARCYRFEREPGAEGDA